MTLQKNPFTRLSFSLSGSTKTSAKDCSFRFFYTGFLLLPPWAWPTFLLAPLLLTPLRDPPHPSSSSCPQHHAFLLPSPSPPLSPTALYNSFGLPFAAFTHARLFTSYSSSRGRRLFFSPAVTESLPSRGFSQLCPFLRRAPPDVHCLMTVITTRLSQDRTMDESN